MDISVKTMMPIVKPEEYKIHFAVYNKVEQPLDVFIRDKDEWQKWNSWRGIRDDFSRRYIFSLIRYYHQPYRWLFGGIFEVLGRTDESYVVQLSDKYSEYIGRLLIDYAGPNSRGRAFLFEKHYDALKVAQIFERPFEGEMFCGYDNIAHDFSQLELIIKRGQLDWKAALENVKGVYLIVDKSNGMKYVGSAYGDTGIWSRWSAYVNTGHGGNYELIQIINDHNIQYARDNFQFSLLEFYSMRTDDQTIIEREQYWKRVLLTNSFGYNKN